MAGTQEEFNDFQRGLGTDLAPNWRDLAGQDSRRLPELLTQECSPNLGTAKIPVERYTSYEFHRLEVEKIWKRMWQVVCREEEIPNVGDHFVYNVAELSFVIVRTAETTFKGYWNHCLHRGRRLVDASGCGKSKFQCKFHSWTWTLGGELAYRPGEWDFPDVEADKYRLREVQIDTWGGIHLYQSRSQGASLVPAPGIIAEAFRVLPSGEALLDLARPERGKGQLEGDHGGFP